MFNGKLVATLIAITVAVIVVCSFNVRKTISESFGFGGLPSMTWKRERVIAEDREAAARGDFRSVPGYQAGPLPPVPRGGVDIRYSAPSGGGADASRRSLMYGDMARADYGKSADSASTDSASGNYKDAVYESMRNSEYPDATAMVPVGDMTAVNALGEDTQPIVYDRYIYANRSNRLRSQGDPFRGDLPIAPHPGDWFRPSAQPSIDLQAGAMSHLVDPGTSQALAELMNPTIRSRDAGERPLGLGVGAPR